MARSHFPLRPASWGAFLAALCLALAVPAIADAQRFGGFSSSTNGVQIKSSPKFMGLFRTVIAGACTSTVRVQCNGKDAALAVVVREDGYLLTKASDLEGRITVKLRDGKSLEAKLVGVHASHDLALLKVDGKGLTPVRWQDSKVAAVGNWVASVGTGAEPAAVGVVSVATRNVPDARIPRPAPPGGGGFLGIGLADEGPGAIVGDVQPGSAAARAGVKVNDVIVAVGGKEVADAEGLIRAISRHKPGAKILLKVKRGEEALELEAKLGKRPKGGQSRGDFQNNLGSKLSKRRSGFPTILQHDSVVLPEDCGGPLVDLDGNVVGLNIARAGRTESYAIPSEVIRAVLPDLLSGRLAPKAASK